MHLHTYLIRSQAPHTINSHMYQAVTILSSKMNKVMGQNYVLLVVRVDFHICMKRQQLEETRVLLLWM